MPMTTHPRHAGAEPSGLAGQLGFNTSTQPRPHLSIVSTMYRSRGYLEVFLSGCQDAVRACGITDFEIVLVNDGSPDDSLDYAVARQKDIAELVVVDLSRNFGHHCAVQAGLREARGDLVFLIDCDLEVSPSVLPDFYSAIDRSAVDLVYGFQAGRKGGFIERAGGGLFYKGFNLLSDIPIPENMLTERIMTRRFVEALLTMGDRNLFMGGMMSWTGFRQAGIAVAKKQRKGASTYTAARRFQLMVNAVSSFSSKPLVWLFNTGMIITAMSFAYVVYLIVRRIFYADALLGFTSLMASVALSLGILTTAIGIVGIYLAKVFNQVLDRPTYIIKNIYRSPPPANPEP